MIDRRGLILGLTGVFCAPAIVRASSLMAIKPISKGFWVSPGVYVREVDVCGYYPYDPVMLDIIRRQAVEAIARDICGVQPMKWEGWDQIAIAINKGTL